MISPRYASSDWRRSVFGRTDAASGAAGAVTGAGFASIVDIVFMESLCGIELPGNNLAKDNLAIIRRGQDSVADDCRARTHQRQLPRIAIMHIGGGNSLQKRVEAGLLEERGNVLGRSERYWNRKRSIGFA